MPRGSRLTEEERAQAEVLRRGGKNNIQIAVLLGQSLNCISQFFLKGCTEGRFSKGRPQILSPRDQNRIGRLISNSTMSSNEVKTEIGATVSKSTILRVIKRNSNITREKMKPAPRLLDRHKTARIDFARMNIGRDWSTVIFSDEKKFNYDGPDGFSHYWRDLRKDPLIFSRRNFGGGSLMVWAGFCSLGTLKISFVSCRMDSEDYQETLENHLLPFLHAHPGQSFIFQQDNAAIHSSKSTATWFRNHQINVLPWPACSPDLNPVENLWSIVAKNVYKNARQFSNKEDLKQAILDAWSQISDQTIANLIASLPNRLLDVVAARGGAINY